MLQVALPIVVKLNTIGENRRDQFEGGGGMGKSSDCFFIQKHFKILSQSPFKFVPEDSLVYGYIFTNFVQFFKIKALVSFLRSFTICYNYLNQILLIELFVF